MERHGLSPFELLVLVGTAVAASLAGVVWLGAWLAAAAVGEGLDSSLADAFSAAIRLPRHLREPRLAWPTGLQARLPGPVLYWGATAVVAVGALGLGVVVLRLLGRSNVGTLPRRPLGVDGRARFATARDLKPLVVRGEHAGRFLLGRHGRHRLATELPPDGRRRRRVRDRHGDRGAVALIGPSRSGKTTAAIAGILEWQGPAVLSSVKADLLARTCGWRSEVGKVRVYDPTHTTATTPPPGRPSGRRRPSSAPSVRRERCARPRPGTTT